MSDTIDTSKTLQTCDPMFKEDFLLYGTTILHIIEGRAICRQVARIRASPNALKLHKLIQSKKEIDTPTLLLMFPLSRQNTYKNLKLLSNVGLITCTKSTAKFGQVVKYQATNETIQSILKSNNIDFLDGVEGKQFIKEIDKLLEFIE